MKQRKTYQERKDLYTLIVVLVCIICFVAIVAKCYYDNPPCREDFKPVVVTVRSGDTPWSIAGRYCPEGMNKQEYLTWVAEENGMDNWGYIHAGEEIVFLELKK